ncbi:MAG TPA: hypothetical protein VFE78_15920, partial [Gemmataceae bacterium]|nr:hypothetical protein [Gemmataceae bacterium]
MAPCGRRSLAKRYAGVLAALLAGSLCAPSAARAGCGHRPFLGDGPGELKLLTDDAASRPGQAPDGAKPATPCKGPGCSRGPSQAPATPPAPAPRELKPSWALVPGPLPAATGPAGRLYPLPSPSPV